MSGISYNTTIFFQVMDYMGVEEIPKRHILKRWTRDARDVLLGHLEVYKNDHASGRSFTCRHSLLYKKALELVRLGDASAEAYERFDSLFESNLLSIICGMG
jgi:hypothetical protein